MIIKKWIKEHVIKPAWKEAKLSKNVEGSTKEEKNMYIN